MSLNSDIRAQVRSLLSQGLTISTEYANKRRFKTKSWLTGGQLAGRREEQVMAELEAILQEHQGEYVRLIGVEPQAKRRAVQIVIQRPEDTPGTGTVKATAKKAAVARSSNNGRTGSNGNGKLSGEVVQQVRSLLAQGCDIGLEHASERRFKTKSWLTVGQFGGSESQVISQVKAAIAEYPGEYVRLIGVNPDAKRRVAEAIVQRPGDTAVDSSSARSGSSYSNGTSYSSSSSLSSETLQEIRSLLAAGYKIGMEHADKRRFKTKSWQSCSPIDSNRETEVVAALEACLSEHQGEYVRLIGIDPNAKRRVSETIIQRPGNTSKEKASTAPAASYSNGNGQSNGYSRNGYSTNGLSSNSLGSEALQEIRSLLAAGYKIGTEHADKRRFKTKSWQSCSPIDSTREADVVSALEACLGEHQGEYVRLIGIDPNAKRRVSETIIQRP